MKPTSNSDSQRSLPGIRPPKIFADGLDVSDVVDVVTADIAAEDVIDDTPPTETTDVGVSDIGTKDIGGLSDELPEFGESASADLIPTASEPTEQTAVIASDELPELDESASADLIPTASEPTEQTAVIASDELPELDESASDESLERAIHTSTEPIPVFSESTKPPAEAKRPAFTVPEAPLRYNSMAQVLRAIRDIHPLPREMQLAQQPVHQTWLLAQINYATSYDRLRQLAFSMNYKDLALLFPALATVKNQEQIDRINGIIKMRASKYLYIHGWLTLQFTYPRIEVQKALAKLCEALENAPYLYLSVAPDAFLKELETLDLGEGHYNWQNVPLISSIIMPNDRYFIGGIVDAMNQSELAGVDFFRKYGIYEDLPLGEIILEKWEASHYAPNRSDGSMARRLFDIFRRN